MNLDLTGQVVCVTGGSEGIGLATAQAFANEGAHVVIADRETAMNGVLLKQNIGQCSPNLPICPFFIPTM